MVHLCHFVLILAACTITAQYETIWSDNMNSISDWDCTNNPDDCIVDTHSNCPNSNDCLKLARDTAGNSWMERETSISAGYTALRFRFDVKTKVDNNNDDWCEVYSRYGTSGDWTKLWSDGISNQLYFNEIVSLPSPVGASVVQISLDIRSSTSEDNRCYWDNAILEGIEATLSPTTNVPTSSPTRQPTKAPITSGAPTKAPSFPTPAPTNVPTISPTNFPTTVPTNNPTSVPSVYPTYIPTIYPSVEPSRMPSMDPSTNPSKNPSFTPSSNPILTKYSGMVTENPVVHTTQTGMSRTNTVQKIWLSIWIVGALCIVSLVCAVIFCCCLVMKKRKFNMRKDITMLKKGKIASFSQFSGSVDSSHPGVPHIMMTTISNSTDTVVEETTIPKHKLNVMAADDDDDDDDMNGMYMNTMFGNMEPLTAGAETMKGDDEDGHVYVDDEDDEGSGDDEDNGDDELLYMHSGCTSGTNAGSDTVSMNDNEMNSNNNTLNGVMGDSIAQLNEANEDEEEEHKSSDNESK